MGTVVENDSNVIDLTREKLTRRPSSIRSCIVCGAPYLKTFVDSTGALRMKETQQCMFCVREDEHQKRRRARSKSFMSHQRKMEDRHTIIMVMLTVPIVIGIAFGVIGLLR